MVAVGSIILSAFFAETSDPVHHNLRSSCVLRAPAPCSLLSAGHGECHPCHCGWLAQPPRRLPRGRPGAPCLRQVHSPVTSHTCVLWPCYHCCHQSRLSSASATSHERLTAVGIQHLSGAPQRLIFFQKCSRNSLKIKNIAKGAEGKLILTQTEKINYSHKKTNLRSAIELLFKSITGLVKNYSLYAKYKSQNVATLHEGFVENEKFRNKSVQYSPVMGVFQ